MDNEIESLRQKLALERRTSMITERGFLVGAMASAWGLMWYLQAHPQSFHFSVGWLPLIGLGCAMCGWVLAKLSVAAFRLHMHRKWRLAHVQRFGRVLHTEPIKKADWK